MYKKLGITVAVVLLIALQAVSAPPPPKNPFALLRCLSKPLSLGKPTVPALRLDVIRGTFGAPKCLPRDATPCTSQTNFGIKPVATPVAMAPLFRPTFPNLLPEKNCATGAACSLELGGLSSAAALPVSLVRQETQTVQKPRGRFPDRTQIDAVIFDMDGTLLDSLSAWEHASARYLQTRGVEVTAKMEEYIQQTSLLEGANYLKRELNLSESPEELLAGTLEIVRQRYLTDVTPKAGALQLLRTLQAQGVKISVATASDKELAQRVFEKWGMDAYIDFIITCDEVGAGKLSPVVYETALERLGTERRRTLVVEDALYALQTAKKAGFLTAGIAEPYQAADQEQVQQTGDFFFISFEDSLR